MSLDPIMTGVEPERSGSMHSSPSVAAGSGPHRFLSFFLDGRHYALPAYAVAEVVNVLSPIPLPNTSPTLLGIAPLRGDIIAVVEPREQQPAEPMAAHKAVVLRPNERAAGLPVAFHVDRIGELLHLDAGSIRFPTMDVPMADFETLVDGQPVFLIDPARITSLVTSPEQ